MRKALLLFLGLFMAQWALSQTIVVLELPEPCASNAIEESSITDFGFDVFPNPADRTVTLSFSNANPIGKVEVLVCDMKGVAISSKQYYSSFNEFRTEMDLGNIAPGVYTISVRGKDMYSVKKLIIKK